MVVVQQQPGVVMASPQMKPDNHLALSIVACLCCNGCCLGLVALICALQSDSDFSSGKVDEARNKGEMAKKLAIAAIVLAIATYVLCFFLNTGWLY